jgi:hypothetical protein
MKKPRGFFVFSNAGEVMRGIFERYPMKLNESKIGSAGFTDACAAIRVDMVAAFTT